MKENKKWWLEALIYLLVGITLAFIFTISGKALTTEPYVYNGITSSDYLVLGNDFITDVMFTNTGYSASDYPYIWYWVGNSPGINPNATGTNYFSVKIWACPYEPVMTVSGNDILFNNSGGTCIYRQMAFNQTGENACSSPATCTGRYYPAMQSYSNFLYKSDFKVGNLGSGTGKIGGGGVNRTALNYTKNSNGNVHYEPFTESHGYYFGNFDLPVLSGTNYSQYFNIINFVPNPILIYNPDYLLGNSDYKQVCVGYNKLFTILPTELQNPGGSLYVVYDYMLYNKPLYGLSSYQYSNGELSPNPGTQNLIYLDPESLSIFLSDSDNSYNLNFTGYSSIINNFYGWSFFLNHSIYNTDNTVNQFTAFKINDVFTYKPDCVEVEIEGHTQCVYNSEYFSSEIITNLDTEYCFYIRSDNDLHVFEVNDYGDIDDTITIDGYTYTITTTYFEEQQELFNSDNSYKGLINSFLAFLKSATLPIAYVNGFIYQFIKGLPLPLQYLTSSIIIGILFIILVRLFANKH